MHFKGEYWIIGTMCLKIWYMPLKPAIDIHNNCTTKTHCCTYIHMRDVSFCQATNWVDTYLHLHTYFHNPKKKGFELWIRACPTGGAPDINYGKNMKKKLWKNRSICPSPLILQEKSIMEIMATSKNYGKKKVRITSGIFWTLMGKNPIMEKSDSGAACLSWTCFFP